MSQKVRAKRLLAALTATCQRMQSTSDALWEESLGRNISYVCGPLAWLTRVGILKTCLAGHKRPLTLGKSSKTSKRLCSGVPERKKAESVLLRWVGLADAAEVQPPASCEQWVVEHERLGKVFNNQKWTLGMQLCLGIVCLYRLRVWGGSKSGPRECNLIVALIMLHRFYW